MIKEKFLEFTKNTLDFDKADGMCDTIDDYDDNDNFYYVSQTDACEDLDQYLKKFKKQIDGLENFSEDALALYRVFEVIYCCLFFHY